MKVGKGACKNCKMIVFEGEVCPGCGGREFTENWKGLMIIFDPENSEVAKEFNINKKGTYAIVV